MTQNPTSSPTMRDLWEDVRNRHCAGLHNPPRCYCCGREAPCIDNWNAVAALKMLDEAHRCGQGIQTTHTMDELVQCRLVLDPETR